MNKEYILEIIEENGFPVKGRHKTAININQSGTLNEDKLNKEKRLFFRFLTEYTVNDLVKEIQHYPENDISEVDFESDFIIYKRKDIDKIKNFIDQLMGVKEIMVNE